MLITTLLHPAGPGRPVVVTRADLTRLIGAAAARLPELAGLLVADDLDAALAVLNRADTAVLITGAPPAPQGRARLAAALQARPGRVGVLLGGWTPEASWRIDRDGHVQTPPSDQTSQANRRDVAAASACWPVGPAGLPT